MKRWEQVVARGPNQTVVIMDLRIEDGMVTFFPQDKGPVFVYKVPELLEALHDKEGERGA